MAADPTSDEYTIRVVGIYATKWRYVANRNAPDAEWFTNTRLEAFERNFSGLLRRLPRPIASRNFAADTVRFTSPVDVTVTSADLFLFVLPSNQVVAAFTVDCRAVEVSVDPAPAAEMLDEFADDAFTIEGTTLQTFLTQMAPRGTRKYEDSRGKPSTRRWRLGRTERATEVIPSVELAERHQIVFVSRPDRLGPAIIDKILYRRQPQLWKEFAQRKDPIELNERGQCGVVTSNTSFIQGHDAMLEDSVFLATVQAVGTLSRFRQIWDYAYDTVRRFRQEEQRDETGTQERNDLERLVDVLGNLEFDLTFSVEFPLMRIESYHSALSDVLDLDGQSNRLSRMFDQLGGSVQSEITAIDIRDSRRADVRRRRNELAFNILALIGVPIGTLLAFFGVSANNVNHDQSMFAVHLYKREYIAALALGAMPIVILGLATVWARIWQHRRRKAHEREKLRSVQARLDNP